MVTTAGKTGLFFIVFFFLLPFLAGIKSRCAVRLVGGLDVEDIDLLTSAVLSNETDTRFDLNSDAQINQDDRQTWVEGLRFTYFGDSNLDGEFSSADFVAVFQRGEYEDLVPMNSNWADGDWNGDGDFSSSDFVLAFQSGGYELGPRSIANVPEPSGTNPILIALLSYLVCAQFRTKLTTSRAQSRCS